jgi:hypothetical protein
MTTSVSAASAMVVSLVSSATAARAEVNSLTSSIYVAGAQMEEGTFATSYIPTNAAPVTRAGDFASIDGNKFSSLYNPAEGTFGVQFQTMFTTSSIPRYILTGNNNQPVYLSANTGTVASFDGQAPALSGSLSAYGVHAKAFLGYSASGRSLAARGALATSSTQNFSAMTSLRIGHLDTVPLCGWIKSLVYYTTRLSDAAIQAMDLVVHSFTIALGTNPTQEITVTLSASAVDTLYVLMSKTQTTLPTAAQVIASGVALPSSTTAYTFTDLDQGATYYGWAVATKQGAESDVIGTASLTLDPEAWWAAGVNINYRQKSSWNMFQIRNTSGFTGGTISVYDIVFTTNTGGSDGNRFPTIQFGKQFGSTSLPIDENSFDGWLIVPKFGNNVDRKRVIDFIQEQTGSALKPELKTWT